MGLSHIPPAMTDENEESVKQLEWKICICNKEILDILTLKSPTFCDVTLCILAAVYSHLEERMPPSEMSVNFYKTTQHHITEDSTLQTYCCEYLQYHLLNILCRRGKCDWACYSNI
jgi:hypothetical protein